MFPPSFVFLLTEPVFFKVIDEQAIESAIQNDAKSIDRLAERCYSRDYTRMGLGCLNVNPQQHRMQRSEPFRITLVNTSYTVCRSYPSVLVVPQSVSDDSVRRFSRSHRQYRYSLAPLFIGL
jgi:myotubularin-related protein 5/13